MNSKTLSQNEPFPSMKVMDKFNCPKDCPDRFPGDGVRPNCHMACPHGYTEWNEQHQKELEEKWQRNYCYFDIEGHKDEVVFRAKKRRNRR